MGDWVSERKKVEREREREKVERKKRETARESLRESEIDSESDSDHHHGDAGPPGVALFCFVLLEPTWMLYRVPRRAGGGKVTVRKKN